MRHLDEARKAAEEVLVDFLRGRSKTWRALLIEDVFARQRAVLWCPKKDWGDAGDHLKQRLESAAEEFWSGDLIRGRDEKDLPDGPWQAVAWGDGRSVDQATAVRVLERHRAKTGWFEAPDEPPWKLGKSDPAVVLFYSFKGGVGRSTALAATALRLAAGGDRVVVIDGDLDAPGVGALLAGMDGSTAPWGVVDYLLEHRILGSSKVELSDYFHRCSTPGAVGGEVLVFPVGTLDDRYVTKLARIDYGAANEAERHPFVSLLEAIRGELTPRWILVDARAGLGDVSGFLTGGVCHLHVLLGTLAEASWQGLGLLLERLGGARLRQGRGQAECFLVAGMVPRIAEQAFVDYSERFRERGRDVFSEHYYADEGADFWTLDDVESADAPHVPVVLPYETRLAVFRELREVAESVLLKDETFAALAERVRSGVERLRESAK